MTADKSHSDESMEFSSVAWPNAAGPPDSSNDTCHVGEAFPSLFLTPPKPSSFVSRVKSWSSSNPRPSISSSSLSQEDGNKAPASPVPSPTSVIRDGGGFGGSPRPTITLPPSLTRSWRGGGASRCASPLDPKPIPPEIQVGGSTCMMVDSRELEFVKTFEHSAGTPACLVQLARWGGDMVAVSSRPLDSVADALEALDEVKLLYDLDSADGEGEGMLLGYSFVSVRDGGDRSPAGENDSVAGVEKWRLQAMVDGGEGWGWEHVMPRTTGEMWEALQGQGGGKGGRPPNSGGLMGSIKAMGSQARGGYKERYGILVVTAYHEQGTLHERLELDREGAGEELGIAARAAILLQTVENTGRVHALEHAHLGIHPRNVLLRPDQEGGTSLANYQLAMPVGAGRSLADTERLALRQRRGLAVPDAIRYAAPELLAVRGGGGSLAADIYSLGMLAYALLAGEKPFACLTDSQVGFHVATRDVRPLWPEGAEEVLPEGLRRCVEACWSSDPAARPSVTEVETAVRDAIDAIDDMLG